MRPSSTTREQPPHADKVIREQPAHHIYTSADFDQWSPALISAELQDNLHSDLVHIICSVTCAVIRAMVLCFPLRLSSQTKDAIAAISSWRILF